MTIVTSSHLHAIRMARWGRGMWTIEFMVHIPRPPVGHPVLILFETTLRMLIREWSYSTSGNIFQFFIRQNHSGFLNDLFCFFFVFCLLHFFLKLAHKFHIKYASFVVRSNLKKHSCFCQNFRDMVTCYPPLSRCRKPALGAGFRDHQYR